MYFQVLKQSRREWPNACFASSRSQALASAAAILAFLAKALQEKKVKASKKNSFDVRSLNSISFFHFSSEQKRDSFVSLFLEQQGYATELFSTILIACFLVDRGSHFQCHLLYLDGAKKFFNQVFWAIHATFPNNLGFPLKRNSFKVAFFLLNWQIIITFFLTISNIIRNGHGI